MQFFKKKQGEFADGHGETATRPRLEKCLTGSAGSTARSCAPPTGVAPIRLLLLEDDVKNGLITWETEHRPTTRDPSGTCPTTSRAAARAGPRLFLVHLQRQPPE
ncbi:hypothetical protein ACG3RN_24670 [Pseudomonas aeruginosa]